MKKVLLSIILFSLLFVPVLVLAQGPQTPPGNIDLWEALASLRDYLFGVLLIVAVIFLVIAGFYFLTAQGDVEKFAKARRFVLYALIGVGVAVASRALVDFIDTIVRGQ